MIAIAMTPVASGLIAIGLVLSQWPDTNLRRAASAETAHDVAVDRLPPLEAYRARDGATLGYRAFQPSDPLQDAPIVVMLHGAGGHSGWMAQLALGLAARKNAIVIAPDLRGHGPSPARRGDVDYIGQLEDDVADLIGHLDSEDREIVLLGHSAGGGLAIRFAGGNYSELVDKMVLVAPFLQHDAPTALPADPDGWARPLVRRIAGLWMFNAVGISLLNHLTVVEFRFPDEVLDGSGSALATQHYSYRLQFSLSPRRDWRKDVAGLPRYLVVAGSADTTFGAEAYEPALGPIAPRGDFVVLDGAGHADILVDVRLLEIVSSFIAGAD